MNPSNKQMPFGKGNYIRLLLSVALVATGFFIMSLETSDYGQGFLGMTLGPLIVLSGFVMGFFAIFHNSSQSSDKS